MPESIIALLATAIHQTQSPDTDPVALDRTLGLLARATEGNPVVLEGAPNGVGINGLLVAEPAPGARLLKEALLSHDTSRVQFPGGLEQRHWREIADVFAGAPALLPSATHVLAALRVSLPMTELWARNSGPAAVHTTVRPGVPAAAEKQTELTTRAAHLGSFSAELGQLYSEGSAAIQGENAKEIARVLLAFRALEIGGDPAQAAVVSKERRRVVTPVALDWLLRAAASPTTPTVVAQALGTLAASEIERLFEAIGRAGSPRERDALAQIFDHVEDLTGLVVLALRGGPPLVARGAAEIAGRRSIVETIPALALLLRQGDAEVRTAAWRALEQIGTREAIEALSTKGR